MISHSSRDEKNLSLNAWDRKINSTAIIQIFNKNLIKFQRILKSVRSELGTANLHSIPQPPVPQNCKKCSATANPQVYDRFAVTFRTSATANAHCTSANLDHNIYCYFVGR